MRTIGIFPGLVLGLAWLALAGEGVAQMPPPMPGAGAEPESGGAVLAGTVLESIDAGRYTYVRFEQDGKEVWAAGPKSVVPVGASVEMPAGLPMANFASPSLNRTFDLVYFVNEIRVDGQPASAAAMPAGMPQDDVHQNLAGQLPPGHPDISGLPAGHPEVAGLPPGHPDIGGMPAPVAPPLPENLERGTVVQALQSGRYTYVEVKDADGTRWLAAPKVDLEVGQSIQFTSGMEMKDFESSALGRKFDVIHFVTAVYPVAD